MEPSLETSRLTLRPFTRDDAEFLLELVNVPEFHEHIGDRGIRTLEQAREYLDSKLKETYERHGFGLMRVALKETDQSIGMAGVLKREALEDPDLGYAFLPAHWRKGYAFEACEASLQHARETLGFKRVLAAVSPANTPSIRLLEKLGFTYERMVSLGDEEDPIKLYATKL